MRSPTIIQWFGLQRSLYSPLLSLQNERKSLFFFSKFFKNLDCSALAQAREWQNQEQLAREQAGRNMRNMLANIPGMKLSFLLVLFCKNILACMQGIEAGIVSQETRRATFLVHFASGTMFMLKPLQKRLMEFLDGIIWWQLWNSSGVWKLILQICTPK